MNNLIQRYLSKGHAGFYSETSKEKQNYYDFIKAVEEKDIKKMFFLKTFHFKDGASFLHKAVCCEKPGIIKIIVKELKMNPNEGDRQGRTPLHYLAENGNVFYADIINILLSAGADINKRDASGWTPLVTAKKCNNEKVLSLLALKGAELDEHKNKVHSFSRKIRLVNNFERACLANYYIPDPLTVLIKSKIKNQKNVVFCLSCKDSWGIEFAMYIETIAGIFKIKPLFGFIIDDFLCFPKTNEAYVKLWNNEECGSEEFFMIKETLEERFSQEERLEIMNNCTVNVKEVFERLNLEPYLERIKR